MLKCPVHDQTWRDVWPGGKIQHGPSMPLRLPGADRGGDPPSPTPRPGMTGRETTCIVHLMSISSDFLFLRPTKNLSKDHQQWQETCTGTCTSFRHEYCGPYQESKWHLLLAYSHYQAPSAGRWIHVLSWCQPTETGASADLYIPTNMAQQLAILLQKTKQALKAHKPPPLCQSGDSTICGRGLPLQQW